MIIEHNSNFGDDFYVPLQASGQVLVSDGSKDFSKSVPTLVSVDYKSKKLDVQSTFGSPLAFCRLCGSQ